MATDSGASATVEPELGTSVSQSLTKAALKQKKRRSKHSSTIYPDPFRYGNPNPLDCHPYNSGKHPDYIRRPHSAEETLKLPVLSATAGADRLSVYGEDDLDASRNQRVVPRPMSVDSLTAILEFFDSNSLSRAMAGAPNMAARTPPQKVSPEKKSSVPHIAPRLSVQPNSRIHFAGPTGENTAVSTEENREVRSMPRNETIRKVPQSPKVQTQIPAKPRPLPIMTAKIPLTPRQANPSLPSDDRTLVSEPPIRFHPKGGLPVGWQRAHDRFIAYLDTHSPGKSSRQRNSPQYTLEQMVHLLKKRFDNFEHVCIPTWVIARRLEILDLSNNNYFDMTYDYYDHEHWGAGI